MFKILVIFLFSICAFCSEQTYLPAAQQVIKIKYGITTVTIYSENEFMTIFLKSNGIDEQCEYSIKYGSIVQNEDKISSTQSLINESTGIFSEKITNGALLIWPGDAEKSGIIKDIFMSWSAGNKDFGFLYVPTNVKIAVGFELM